MAVDTNLTSLFEKLKVEDPWLPPRTWESIPSQSGPLPPPRTQGYLPSPSSVSEKSLVRLALNALQGVESALVSIQSLSAAFYSDPADRTFHEIPNMWSRSSSTHALGKILKSIGCLGSLVFLLHKFVDHFTNLNLDERSGGRRQENDELEENQNRCDSELQEDKCSRCSLVSQAFAVAVGKVLEGYTCSLDTLFASAGLRRSSAGIDLSSHLSSGFGHLTSVVHSELTLLEVYLHTKELRTQIEALGNICNLHDVALCFLISSFEDLTAKATLEYCNFYRGADLLTFLYLKLKVADPAHLALLKFLFFRSCEPYCGFIRSWIFKAEISDPYKEFIVECVDDSPRHSPIKAGISPLASVRERDGAAVPCFLKDFLVPLIRVGQQLQVLMKLLELCNYATCGDHSYADLLPSSNGFSTCSPFYVSALTFSREHIEEIVLARKSYYNKMQKKLENLLKKLEFYSEEDAGDYSVPILHSNRESLDSSVQLQCSSSRALGDMDIYDYGMKDEFSFVDASESSECSSVNGSEEKTESEELVDHTNSLMCLRQDYLSALSFSMSTPLENPQKCLRVEKLCHLGTNSNDICEGIDTHNYSMPSHHNGKFLSNISMPLKLGESNWSCADVQYADSQPGSCWPLGGLPRNPFYVYGGFGDKPNIHPSDSCHKLSRTNLGFCHNGASDFSETFSADNALVEDNRGEEKVENDSISNLFVLHQEKGDYNSNFLSMNPMLTKGAMFNLMGKSEEHRNGDNGKFLPYFNFSSVDDPFKACIEKLGAGSSHELFDSSASATGGKVDHNRKQGYGGDDIWVEDAKVSYGHLPLDFKDQDKEDAMSINYSGGSAWETLLGGSSSLDANATGDQRQPSAIFEIPVDFVINKCLLQEILLQYKYISKLTFKLLEEGFDLQQHLLALRRYHFMEIADWADLFIMSLWHHKCGVTETDQRVAEIQGLLELSVQRSSCEQDVYKNRLFVYMKGHGMMPLSTSAIGVHSFDFLGLGYRVDWPVSIILTPAALKIYANIFSFLIQVKLAVSSLTDVWCSLKDLMHLISKNHHSAAHGQDVCRFNILMKLRHQMNHFVSTLQQYVQSQLSHVSWCRFLHSLKHKVNDMMDLESVHMAYLMESLHICFLSDETRVIASIIESILQCALDFRSSVIGGMWNVGYGQENLLGKLSTINMSQVMAIKQKFDKNLKEMHLLYLKSPKHGEFALPHFWGYLNYNEYYSDVGNEMSHYVFVV